MATAELKSAFAQFVTFTRALKGDEKSEAQTFLDHFFRALGHDGVVEAGGTFMVDGNYTTFGGCYHRPNAGDSDGDGIPDDLDPYPSDPNNNSFWWQGGTFEINNQPVTFNAQYYAGHWADSDGDGLPDPLDPYPNDLNNGNANSFWWPGGTFTINNVQVTFSPQYYSGTWSDSDGDGIPDAADPYPNDPNNNNDAHANQFYWGGGTFRISDNWVTFAPQWYAGAWSDQDNDGIPDVVDPYPTDSNNNNSDAVWWAGGTFYINGASTVFPGQFLSPPLADSDGDGIPDVLDPYPNDSTNNSAPWAGGTFLINGQWVTYPAGWHAANAGDRDGDGLPDDLDPYPNDPWNNTYFTWPAAATTYTINNQSVTFTPTVYGGLFVDTDGDGIPDVADPYPNDPSNNNSTLNDGIPDWAKLLYGLSITDASLASTVRADGITYLQAYQNGVPLAGPNSLLPPGLDSDGDGMTDIYEIQNGLNRFNPVDAVDAPMGDFVFNFEKAQAGIPITTVISSAEDYYNLTGHFQGGLNNDPTKSVAENDWDGDGISNIDEILVFHTDPRDQGSGPTLEDITLALSQGKCSLTTRTNFYWLIDSSGGSGTGGTGGGDGSGGGNGGGNGGGDGSGDGGGSLNGTGNTNPQCSCGAVGEGCGCGTDVNNCGGTTIGCFQQYCSCGCDNFGCFCGQSQQPTCSCGCTLLCCTCNGPAGNCAGGGVFEVSFRGDHYHPLKTDQGQAYDVAGMPQYGGGRNVPVAFTMNTPMQIRARFTINTAGQANPNIGISAHSDGGLDIAGVTPTLATNADGSVTATVDWNASSTPLKSQIQYYNASGTNPFQINWSISINGGPYKPAGTTNHTVYVTMADPIKTAINGDAAGRESLYANGCVYANGMGYAPDAVVDAIYNHFYSLDVEEVRPGTTDFDPSKKMTFFLANGYQSLISADLLATGNGQCTSWAQFLIDILRTQGIDAQYQIINPVAPTVQSLITDLNATPTYKNLKSSYNPASPGQLWMLINNWNTSAPPFNNSWTQGAGLFGQGSTQPNNMFKFHALVEYNGKYYDPSYGTMYGSQPDWEQGSVTGVMVPSVTLQDPKLSLPTYPSWLSLTPGRVGQTAIDPNSNY